jgi:hypothetical protein
LVHYSFSLPHLYVSFVCLFSFSFSAMDSLNKQDNQMHCFVFRPVFKFKLLLIRKRIVVCTLL